MYVKRDSACLIRGYGRFLSAIHVAIIITNFLISLEVDT